MRALPFLPLTLLLVGCKSPSPSPSAAAAPLASAPAAPPRATQPCEVPERVVCVDDRTAVVCIDRVWRTARCRGGAGCMRATGPDAGPLGDDCDQASSDEHEVCVTPDDVACAVDGKALLSCASHEWRMRQPCGGQRACTTNGKRVVCDNSVAKVGDACTEANDYACAVDRKSALRCIDGKFVLAAQCAGPSGCSVGADAGSAAQVRCDDSVAAEGAACDRDGHYSCATDLSRILVCKDHHYVRDDACKKRERCATRGGQIGCY